MAKIVIAGQSNCPRFAKVELLADDMAKNLPNFELHKIVQQPEKWKDWLQRECKRRGWRHQQSPIVWRELVSRGGKGVLIGGANDFQEYVNAYYKTESIMASRLMTSVAADNERYAVEAAAEQRRLAALSRPVSVCVTAAASAAAAYHLLEAIGAGAVFGADTEVAVVLHDATDRLDALRGIQMEAVDLAYPLLKRVTVTDEFALAVRDCAVVVLLDEMPEAAENRSTPENEGPSSTRATQLAQYIERYRYYAKTIDEVCEADTRVLVAGGGPINFCTYLLHQHLDGSRLHRFNVVGLNREFERQVKSVLAQKLAVNSANVKDVIVWGNPPGGQYHVDLTQARVFSVDNSIVGPAWYSADLNEALWDKKWLRKEAPRLFRERRGGIVDRLPSSRYGLATAQSIVDFLYQWCTKTDGSRIYSLSVYSEGWYSVPEGLVFSFPVNMHPRGYWTVCEDIDINEDTKAALNLCIEDTQKEREVLYPPPKEPTPEPTDDEYGLTFPTNAEPNEPDVAANGAGEVTKAPEEGGYDDKNTESILVSLDENLVERLSGAFPDLVDKNHLRLKLAEFDVDELLQFDDAEFQSTIEQLLMDVENETLSADDKEDTDDKEDREDDGIAAPGGLGLIVEEPEDERTSSAAS